MNLLACVVVLVGCVAASAQTEFPKADGLASTTSYSHVVVSSPGKLVFVAGQVANDPEGKIVGKGDLRAQTVQVFENLKKALAAGGATFDDVVKINWYVKNFKTEMLPTLREVRSMNVKKSPPASTLVGVAALANDDYLLEVEAVASLPGKSGAK
jgi:enamine deaminase RidA (YjgF/YER057c/UK114 family)